MHAHDVVMCIILVLVACAQDDSSLFAFLSAWGEETPFSLQQLLEAVLDAYPKETHIIYDASKNSSSVKGLYELVSDDKKRRTLGMMAASAEALSREKVRGSGVVGFVALKLRACDTK